MCDEQTTKTLRHLISFQIFLMAYIIAFSAHSYAFSLAVYPVERMSNVTTDTPTTTPSSMRGRQNDESHLDLAIIISSYVSCSLISLGTIIVVVFDSVVRCNIPTPMPLIAKIMAPFCLSSSVRALIDSSAGESDDFAGSAKIVTSYFWIYLIAFMLLLHLIEACLDIFPVLSCCDSFCEFLTRKTN